jgi:uncharacterized protein (DUF1697 family)
VTVRIAFLRAVNVGRRRVPMSVLSSLCRDLGYADPRTHINSGNVVFSTTGSRASVEKAMEKALEAEFGFECTTFVRTARELANIVEDKPFPVAPGDTHFVTFLKEAPAAGAAKLLEGLSNDFDTLVVHGADVHWRMRGKSTDSRLVKRDWERILGPLSSTSRNMTMLTKLNAKIEATR